MKPYFSLWRRVLPALVVICLSRVPSAWGQLPTTEERLKIFTDPESVKAKLDKEKLKPPIEFFRSQVAPFDILPFVKANHWSTISLEMRANYENYAGLLQTSPVRLMGMPREGVGIEAPQEVIYRREARLLKEQRMRLSFQALLPRIPRELGLELTRPDAIRADEIWPASLRTLEPQQMLILFLTKDGGDAYARWSHLQAMVPMSIDRGDTQAVDRFRYYRLVFPLDPEHPPLSAQPLTWTTISHVIWDGMPPDNLPPPQQQAMLDWLHWGGQLILIGGAKPSFAALQDSFLGPYLPADSSGENALLKADDLMPLSKAYRPPMPAADRDDPQAIPPPGEEATAKYPVYQAPQPILPASNRPVFLAGLKPREGASIIPLGESSTRALGVEWRVGHGRVLMLGLNPTDPALGAWPGMDTLVRRVLLRRPEDPMLSQGGWNGREVQPPSFGTLLGPDLSWFRYLARDLGASLPRPAAAVPASPDGPSSETPPLPPPGVYGPNGDPVPPSPPQSSAVAEWVDSSTLPLMTRDMLEEASGISIPSSVFVLKVILAYIIALVPLNWLICRYVLGRREWAWVVVPALSLAFAIGVERAAAYDMGYDAACDEIDVVESHGGYPRVHVSRFASLYTTGRVQFTISYPNEPTAVALPLDNGRSLRGEVVRTATFQSLPVPALEGFQVQPRSLALYRAEHMGNLSGAIALESKAEARLVHNGSDLELRDAVLVDVNAPRDRRETYLGTIAPGAAVEVKDMPGTAPGPRGSGQLNPAEVLRQFREYVEERPENQGEIRLVAWSPTLMPGQKLDPPVDRQRGFTAVVVHLRSGPPPSADGPRYSYLAPGAPAAPQAKMLPEMPLIQRRRVRGRPGMPGAPKAAPGTMPVPPPRPQMVR